MDTLLTRRGVLAALGSIWGGAAGFGVLGRAALAAGRPGFFRGKGLKLGVQLYTLGEELEQDFEGTLRKVAEIGYQRVELAGFLGRTARQLRSSFDRAGLACTSAHIPVAASGPGGGDTLQDVPKLIEDAHVIGLRYIIVPTCALPGSAGGSRMTSGDWRACAELLNEKAALLSKAGLRTGYHNHNLEFAPSGDRTGFEVLMEATDPKRVTFEMDAGWVGAAGLDPVALLKRYPGRFRLMHVKDIKPSTQANFSLRLDPTEVGSGRMEWARILPAAYAAGVREFFVEQEPPFTGSRLAAIEKSFHYLMSL